jgi:hypothetical protein
MFRESKKEIFKQVLLRIPSPMKNEKITKQKKTQAPNSKEMIK